MKYLLILSILFTGCVQATTLTSNPETNQMLQDYLAYQEEMRWRYLEDGTDLYALAKSVSKHETHDCTKGYGKTHNNCFGIMQWDRQGRRSARKFKTEQEAYTEFYRVWRKFYNKFPTKSLAVKWSGNDRADHWYNNVVYFYNQYTN